MDFNNMMNNPMFHMGLGLLGANGNARGAQQGLLSYQQMQQAQAANAYRQAQMQQMQAKAAAKKREMEEADDLRRRQQAYFQQYPNIAPVAEVFPDLGREMLKNKLMPQSPDLPTGMRMGANGPEWIPAYLQGQKELRTAGRNVTNVPVNVALGETLTPAEEAMDKAAVKELTPYLLGKSADSEKMLSQLRMVHKALGEKVANLTGPDIAIQPDPMLALTNPDALNMREAVEEVVQRNLKAVLGGQFTEREGEKLVARAYNPKLSEGKNRERVGRLLTQIEKAHKVKLDAARYLKENGTLRGWDGAFPKMEDFYSAIGEDQDSKIEELLKKYGG